MDLDCQLAIFSDELVARVNAAAPLPFDRVGALKDVVYLVVIIERAATCIAVIVGTHLVYRTCGIGVVFEILLDLQEQARVAFRLRSPCDAKASKKSFIDGR